MNLQKGSRLGPYEIVAHIGSGGMGEVYRARDTRLGRSVAIKILHAEFAQDARLRVRFEREAKTISALNDPHICTIHDVGRENGVDYLVMEHCEGKTLADRIKDGPLSLDQVLEYGTQIAEALDKAHRRGIIHRDLKPSNIMLTKSGVKLLDFGLASRHAATLAAKSSATTMDQPMTEEGKIIGTIHYMAPELFEGKEADARSDIFALGLVLYEMLTGKQAFSGGSKAAVVAAILEHQPAKITASKPATPGSLERLVDLCLAKDPEQRIQSAHDVKLQLEWLARGAEQPAGVQRSASTRVVVWTLAAIAIASVSTLVIERTMISKKPLTPARPISRTVVDLRTAAPLVLGQFSSRIGFFSPLIALSHDGTVLVYVGLSNSEKQLFKRRLDRYEVEAIPGTQGANFAFFSPDDSWIGFLTDDKVMKVPLAGGSPVTVADVNSPVRAVWLPNGTIVVADEEGTAAKFLGERGRQTRLVRFGRRARISDVLPNGKTILVSLRKKLSGDFSGVGIYNVEEPGLTEILDGGYDARYVAPGSLLFARGNDLLAVGFDVKRGQVTGAAVTVQSNIATDPFSHQAQYAFSDAGILAYVPGRNNSVGKIAWIDRKGKTEFLNLPEAAYGVFDLSSDGHRIVVQVGDVTDYLLVFDLARSEGRRIPVRGDVATPHWTPDGREIVAGSHPGSDQPYQIVRIDPARSAESTLLYSSESQVSPTAISRDGQFLAFYEFVGDGFRVGIKAIGEPSPVQWFKHNGWGGDFSPEGRWVAYASPRTGRSEIWLQSADNASRSYQISVDGGVEPRWCYGSSELFYRVGGRWYAVSISTVGEPKWGAPRLVWETEIIDTPGISYDVSPDGQRLLVSKRTSADVTDRIHLIDNWLATLKVTAASPQ